MSEHRIAATMMSENDSISCHLLDMDDVLVRGGSAIPKSADYIKLLTDLMFLFWFFKQLQVYSSGYCREIEWSAYFGRSATYSAAPARC